MSVSFDHRQFKRLERAGFNRIAQAYAQAAPARHRLARALIEAAALEPGLRVLDLASGPATLAQDIARLLGPEGEILATDIAENMLATGRSGWETTPAQAHWLVTDAEHLALANASVDRVMAGLALFMFPHPGLALAECRRVLRRGGVLALSVWGKAEEVPLIGLAQAALAQVLPTPKVPRPSVFRFGDPKVLSDALLSVGFVDIDIHPVDFSCDYASPAQYWDGFLALAGGVAEALSRHPPARQAELLDAVARQLQPWASGNGYRIPARALVARARHD